jgi:adenylate cyclase
VFLDLRGFTALSDRLPAETVVDILNQYFDCQVASIRAHGGEVLKYMGDGLLAVFPIDEYVGDAPQVCSRVLEAAHESRASVADMQYPVGETVERFRFGVALHVGRILYGNIGGGNRLDFTIGPGVILQRGWRRSRAVFIARGWRPKVSPASAGEGGAISASSRSQASRRPSASTG